MLEKVIASRREERSDAIDVWVNNAGIMPTGYFTDQELDVSAKVIEVNYLGVVQSTKILLPLMIDRGRGTILNIASATGAKPLAGAAVYSGSKAAIIGFSDAVRREVRHTGVRIGVILPNLARTQMSAGIRGPKLLGSVSAQQVSAVALRAIRTGRFRVIRSAPARARHPVVAPSAYALRRIGWMTRIGTDKIGLGGEPTARAHYIDEAMRKER